jgi:hypothetical protein
MPCWLVVYTNQGIQDRDVESLHGNIFASCCHQRMTTEVEEDILDAVNETPGMSARRVTMQLGVARFTVWRVLREQPPQLLQASSPKDYPVGVIFCQWCGTDQLSTCITSPKILFPNVPVKAFSMHRFSHKQSKY